jgi:hypothetical protein
MWNNHAGQATASLKRVVSDANKCVWEIDVVERYAVNKRCAADAREALGSAFSAGPRSLAHQIGPTQRAGVAQRVAPVRCDMPRPKPFENDYRDRSKSCSLLAFAAHMFRRPTIKPSAACVPLVIMRKVVQGTRSEKGLENYSVLRSLFETVRRQDKKPQEFFWVLLTQSTAQAQAALYRHPLHRKPRPSLRC